MNISGSEEKTFHIGISISQEELGDLLLAMDRVSFHPQGDEVINDGMKLYHELYNALSEVLGEV